MSYYIGSLVRLLATFKDIDGVEADPTAIQVQVKRPDGSVNTYTYADADITKSATGQYYIDISTTMGGMWRYHWKGTGAVQAAAQSSFLVVDENI